MGRTLISGGRLITPFKEVDGSDLLLAGGKIAKIGPAGTIRDFDSRIEAAGKLVIPGLIDVHVQGAGGADVLDGTPEAIEGISATCARFAVTGYLATTVYRPAGDNDHLAVAATACSAHRRGSGGSGGAAPLGIHLEGPFIAGKKRGMIREDCLHPADGKLLERILKLCAGGLRMMTLAPELEGALELIGRLKRAGVIASFGHSAADYAGTQAGIAAGIDHVTHLFNAMLSMHHREPGPLPAILESPQVSAQLICDGAHIHPAVLRLAVRELGPQRLVLITDGMQAMGLGPGRYTYNGLPYESRDGTARYQDGTLIGTALGLSDLVARCRAHTGCTVAGAVRAASLNPARLLGLADSKGSLEEGKDADLAIVEPDFTVEMTFRDGRRIYRR